MGERVNQCAGMRIPDPGRTVPARNQQAAAVVVEADALQPAGLTGNGQIFPVAPFSDIPDPGSPIIADGEQLIPAGNPGQADCLVVMAI